MHKMIDDLKREFEENPIEVITSIATAAAAVVGVGNMINNRRNSRTWRKEVDRRIKMDKK